MAHGTFSPFYKGFSCKSSTQPVTCMFLLQLMYKCPCIRSTTCGGLGQGCTVNWFGSRTAQPLVRQRPDTHFTPILKSHCCVTPQSPAATACDRCVAWEWHQLGNSAEHQLQPCSPLASTWPPPAEANTEYLPGAALLCGWESLLLLQSMKRVVEH